MEMFSGSLSGLVMAEAELDTAELLAAFPTPAFALREVTHDLRFTGGQLATMGLPREE